MKKARILLYHHHHVSHGATTSDSLEQTKVKVDRENEKCVGNEGLQKRVKMK